MRKIQVFILIAGLLFGLVGIYIGWVDNGPSRYDTPSESVRRLQ